MIYKNKYGSCELELIGEITKVKNFYIKDVSPEYLLDIDDLEKIALITENKNLQIGFSMSLRKGDIVYHHSSDTIQLLRLKELQFTSNVKPSEELRISNKRDRVFL